MDQRKKEKILLGVDLLFLVAFFGSFIGIVVKKYMIEEYPFLLVYIYLEYLALYLTFRLKHCKSMPLPVLYRLHLYNFLFSVFSLITGYIEVIRSINNEGILQQNRGYFWLLITCLISCHIVLSVYVCCPTASLEEYQVRQRGQALRGEEAVPERLANSEQNNERQPLIGFEQLEIDSQTFNSSKNARDSCCSICLEDFKEGEQIKSLPLCRHLFHSHCLKQWYVLSQSDTCPTCRRRFSNVSDVNDPLQNSRRSSVADEEAVLAIDPAGNSAHRHINFAINN